MILRALLLLVSTSLCFGQAATNLSPAQIEGRALTQEILAQRPTANLTNAGALKVRDVKGKLFEYPLRFRVAISNSSTWITYYSADIETQTNVIRGESLSITHSGNQANLYSLQQFVKGISTNPVTLASRTSYNGWPIQELSYASHLSQLFAGSDFWLADLGLEFFHWPEQKVLKHEMRRSRACKVLESTNPNPSTNGYSRVVSWIDNESSGIVHAEAFDAQGKLLKEFDPKEFKKVNGQWQLQEMEIRNVQTKSRTRIEFDVTGK